MNKICLLFVVLAIILAGCTPSVQTPTTVAATAVPSPTIATTPTSAPGMINVDGFSIPDPTLSNPELLDVNASNSPIVQFVKSMNSAGIEVTNQQILDALNDLANFESRTDANGNPYVQFAYTVTQGELSYSTGFLYDEQKGWRKFTIQDLGEKNHIKFGTEGSPSLIEDPRAFELAMEQVDSITPWPNWFQHEPERGNFDFSALDQEIDRWTAKGRVVQNVPLLLASADWSLPEWLNQGNFSKEELARIIEEYVSAVVKHGKEKGIRQWIVVSEPFLPTYRENDIFYKTFGGYEYIDIAFEAARKADPDAILIYNDVDNQDSVGVTIELTQQNVERLKSKQADGKPILDAVGIQAHLGDWAGIPDFDDVKQTIQSYGLPVIVTAFDYNLVGITGSQQQRETEKASVYRNFLSTVLDAGVIDVTFWGLDERNSWLEKGMEQKDADPTMFNASLEPQLAYYAVLNVLSQPTMTQVASTISIMEVNGVSLPDPKTSNPEFFDLKNPESPIYAFIESMKILNISIEPESIVQKLVFEPRTGSDGKTFYQASYYFDPDPKTAGETLEGKIPLFIALQNENGDWIWQKAKPGDLARLTGRTLGTNDWEGSPDPTDYQKEVLNFTSVWQPDVNISTVIKTGQTIEEIIARIKEAKASNSQLNPEIFFDFKEPDKVAKLAAERNDGTMGMSLFVPWAIPESTANDLISGKLPMEDFDLFLEFYTESVVSRYDGNHVMIPLPDGAEKGLLIDRWVLSNETIAYLYTGDRLAEKIIENDSLVKVFQAAKKANKNIKVFLCEDHLLEKNFGELRTKFLNAVDDLISKGVTLDGINIQNHLWLGFPLISDEEMESFFQRLETNPNLEGKEFTINYNEITISQSQINPFWGESVSQPFPNSDFEQAKMLSSILKPMKNRNGLIIFFSITSNPGPFDQNNINDLTTKDGLMETVDSPVPYPTYFVLMQFLSE